MELVEVIGVPNNVIFNAMLTIIHTKPIYVAVLGFAITTSLVLAIVYGWQYSVKRRSERSKLV